MKRILLSAMIIAALGALAVSSTAALFNDQEAVAGNTVAAGTLALTVNESSGKPFAISGAYPGYMSDWEYIDIFNTGNLPFEAYMDFQKTSGSSLLYNNLTIMLETSGGDSVCDNGDGDEHLIYSGLIKDFNSSMVVSDIAYWHLANEDDGVGGPDNIRAGYSERVCQKVGVDASAGNGIMGQTVVFSEIVNAMQDND